MVALTDAEQHLLKFLLDGELPQLRALRRQLDMAAVAGRDFSGVGFFTKFEVPAEAQKIDPPNFVLGDVSFQLENAENGGEALLFVRDGFLDVLEVYNVTDAWPASPVFRVTSYVRPVQKLPANPVSLVPTTHRDYEFVSRQISGNVHGRPSA